MKNTLRALLAAALIGAAQFSAPALAQQAPQAGAKAMPTPQQIEGAVRAGNWLEAEAMLNQVLKARPDSAKAWYWMAQAQEQLKQPAKAAEALSRATKLQPDLKFASPGAAQSMQGRLALAVQSSSQSQIATPARAAAPASSSSGSGFGIGLLLLALAGAGGAGFYFFNKRSKQRAQDELDRERKALVARVNDIHERSTALTKTARFEGQESSTFGVAAAASLSRANSALSRMKDTSSFSARAEREQVQQMESELERLETQAARQAWTEQAQAPAAVSHDADFGRSAPASQASSFQAPTQASSFGGLPAPSRYDGYAPAQAASTQTVVHDSGGGMLQTMMISDALRSSSNGRDSSARERDLERENQRLRDQDRPHSSSSSASSAAPATTVAAFDQGGSSSSDSWSAAPAPKPPAFDSGSAPSSSWDSSPSSTESSSSSWDSGSSSSSSDDSSSSSSSSSSDSSSTW